MDSAEQTGGKREGKISLMFHQFSFIPFNPYLSLSLPSLSLSSHCGNTESDREEGIPSTES